MTDIKIEQKERFKLLLQQLNLTDDTFVRYFQESAIEKLMVDRKQKKWHFYFYLEKILPYDIYALFVQRLVESFKHIVETNDDIGEREIAFTINFNNGTILQIYGPIEFNEEGIIELKGKRYGTIITK